MGKLTNKQLKFIDEYMIDLNGKEAAIRSGYSPKTAVKIASENLIKPDIAEEIKKRQAESAKKLQITREDMIQSNLELINLYNEMIELALIDIPTPEQERKMVRLSMLMKGSDVAKYKEQVIKMLGFNAPDKIENHNYNSEQPLFGPDSDDN